MQLGKEQATGVVADVQATTMGDADVAAAGTAVTGAVAPAADAAPELEHSAAS